MKRKPSSKKSAFSLVELSIVLIIIGLLVAGVTGGAALIKNAEVRAIMAESNDYKALVSTFYGNFNYVPGDYPIALAGLATGNGNGNIEFSDGSSTTNEGFLAWQQLRQLPGVSSGLVSATTALVNTSATATPAGSAGWIGVNVPGSKSKGGAWLFDYVQSSVGNSAAVVLPNKNVLALLNPAGIRVGTAASNTPCYLTSGCTTTPVINITLTGYTTTNVGILTPQDAFQLDQKADDGTPSTGSIRALNNYNATSTAFSCVTGGASAVNTYETVLAGARSSRNCALTFDFDI